MKGIILAIKLPQEESQLSFANVDDVGWAMSPLHAKMLAVEVSLKEYFASILLLMTIESAE